MRPMLRAPWQWSSLAHHRTIIMLRHACVTVLALSLSACGIVSKPAPQDSALANRPITWRLHASPSLNTLPDGRSLALLVRIYRLRAPERFLHAPADAFGDPRREKDALGDDFVSVHEVQLIPGQRHEAIDKLPRDITHIGIVALFHHPAAGRWRQAFATAPAEITGIDIGLHACAMTIHRGQALGVSKERMGSAAVACD
jgi:type VI secretion system protein VasD